MVISLYAQELINDVREKSHLEVSEITDTEARYRAEAGSEKMGEIIRDIEEGVMRAAHRCLRYLKEQYTEQADNTLDFPDVFTFVFSMSERRAIGKAEPLRSALHTFIVHYALSRFYSSVSQGELSNKHSLIAVDAGNDIEALLYYKQPPRV